MGKYDIIYHLSDTDLDGYGSQYLTSLLNENIKYYNCRIKDYNSKIKSILDDILLNKDKKILLLITDLSLTIDEADRLNNFIRGNSNIDLKIQLLDHHITGLETSKNNKWYYLDVDKCSAKITAYYVINYFEITSCAEINYIDSIGDLIDSHDRWLENSIYHNKANHLADLVYNTLFEDYMVDQKREYIFHIIKTLSYQIIYDNLSMKDIELRNYNMINSYLKNKIDEDIYENDDIKLEHKFYHYLETIYSELKNEIVEMKYNDQIVKFKISVNMDSNLFQYLSHIHLKKNRDLDFMVNLKNNNSKCSLSFRSLVFDVEEIARKHFEGGGHKQACGGKINFNKNFISDTEAKELILNKILN